MNKIINMDDALVTLTFKNGEYYLPVSFWIKIDKKIYNDNLIQKYIDDFKFIDDAFKKFNEKNDDILFKYMAQFFDGAECDDKLLELADTQIVVYHNKPNLKLVS